MRRILTNLCLVLSGLLVGVLAVEIILRLMGFSFPVFGRYDMHAGQRLLEGAQGWSRAEGKAYVRINGQGMRDDREITVQKPEGVYRIAVLGDSFAQAMQLPVEKSFWRVLEGKLNECKPFGERRVEVLNFGVDGYSTAQELTTLRHRVWQFQPDMVLLAFYPGNDVHDNSRKFANHHVRPFFVYRDNQLELDSSFRESLRYKVGSSAPWLMYLKLSQYSRVAQLLNKAREAWQVHRWPESHAPASEGQPELYDHYRIYLPPNENTDWKNAWDITEALIIQMGKEVAAKRATFVIATVSTGIQAHPSRKEREAYAQRIGVLDLLYPERRIEALGKRAGLPVISLAERFQKYAEENQVYLHGFPNSGMGMGHWNENGHGLAGQMISEALCRNKP